MVKCKSRKNWIGRIAKKEKKAQLKIQETAFVLLAIVFLLIIVFLFYFKFHSAQLSKEIEEAKQQQAISLLNKIIAMPELRCSASIGRTAESLCIDKDKLEIMAMEKYMPKYKGIWKGLLEIKAVEIYPETKPSSQEFVLFTKDSKELEEGITYSTFVPLCRTTEGIIESECTIGMILIKK